MKRLLLAIALCLAPVVVTAQTLVNQARPATTSDANAWPMKVVFGDAQIDPRAIRTLTISDQVTAILGASSEVIGHVVVDSVPSTAVTGTFWPTAAASPSAARLTDGTSFYDSRSIRALTSSDQVTIANASLAVTGTFWQTTQPVSQSGVWTQRLFDQSGNGITSTANAIWGVIRDAAGNARGANVTAANALVVDGSATTQPISAASLPLPTGAALDASLTTLDTDVKANVTLHAGANVVGKVGIDQTTPGTTNGVQVNAALPAGTNVIGHVVADSGSTTAVTGNVATTAADGSNVTLGAKTDTKSTATDGTSVSAIQVLKEISAMEQAPASRAVTAATLPLPTGASTESTLSTLNGKVASNTALPALTDAGLVVRTVPEERTSADVALAALNDTVSVTTAGFQSYAGSIDVCTCSLTLTFETRTSAAGSWGTAAVEGPSGTQITSLVLNNSGGAFEFFPAAETVEVRVRVTSATSGSATVRVRASMAVSAIALGLSAGLNGQAATFYRQLVGGADPTGTTRSETLTNGTPSGSDYAFETRNIPSGTQTIAGTVSVDQTTDGTTNKVFVGNIPHVVADSGSTTAVTGNVATTAADGSSVTLGAKADAKSTATDTTAITVMQVLKEISAMEQAPASRAVTNAGTFATQSTIADGADVTLGAKADAKNAATDTTAVSIVALLKEISALEQAPASRAVTNAGTFATQPTPPTLTKGTQGSTGFSVQPLHDAGRSRVLFTADRVTPAASDTLVTFVKDVAGTSTTAQTTYTVTSGKTLRVQAINIGLADSTTTAVSARVALRENTSGTCTASSAAAAMLYTATPAAIAAEGSAGQGMAIPDGLEFPAADSICISAIGSTATGTLTVSVVGFEY